MNDLFGNAPQPSKLKAISLWQPWASAIAFGLKRIETRSWSTPYRGVIAIHAAKRWTADERDYADMFADRYDTRLRNAPRGVIVAVARIVDCRRTECLHVCEQEYDFGNFGPERYGWLLDDVRELREPVPCRGFQSMWPLDQGIADLVNARL